MARPLRIKQNEYPYHISTKTNNSAFLLKNKKWIFEIFALVINLAIKKYNIRVKHIVLMGNHYHLVLQTTNKDIDRVMQLINSMTARLINKRLKRRGHLWGERYFSTIVDGTEYRKEIIRYIYMNPVRAKIVDNPVDYAFSSFRFYAFGQEIDVNIEEDEIFLSFGANAEERRKNLYLFIIEELSIEKINEIKSKLHCPIYGSNEFIKLAKNKFCEAIYSKN
jgi:REP element-mobilizing transposase RayT